MSTIKTKQITFVDMDCCVCGIDYQMPEWLNMRCHQRGEPFWCPAGHQQAGWYAHVKYRGARITVDDRRSPTEAAMALAERLLRGAACRCGKTVTLNDRGGGCRWRLLGKKWEPGCDAPPVTIDGPRGDMAAMNRAMRRAAQRRGRRQ